MGQFNKLGVIRSNAMGPKGPGAEKGEKCEKKKKKRFDLIFFPFGFLQLFFLFAVFRHTSQRYIHKEV